MRLDLLPQCRAAQVGLIWRLARGALAAQSNVSEEQFVDIDAWLESSDQTSSGTVSP